MILDTLATINNSFWNSLFTDNKAFPTNFEEIHRGGQLQKADLTEGLIDAEQINAIKQQQVRPLRVIDIDPNSVDKESGWCVYGDDVLSRMFGPTQNGSGIGGARVDNVSPQPTLNLFGSTTIASFDVTVSSTVGIPLGSSISGANLPLNNFVVGIINSTTLRLFAAASATGPDNFTIETAFGRPTPYARTLQFDIPGNWLKIEYLPARSQGEGIPLEFNYLENPVNVVPQNTNVQINAGQFDGMGQAAGQRGLLLDFESVSATPLLVEDGAEFENYFSSFFLTFYQLNVRIRITIGYNSKTKQEVFKEPNIYMFGGRGLTTKSPIHPISFCVTDREANGNNTGTQMPVNTSLRNLISNPPRVQNLSQGYGVAIVFLTGFNCLAYQQSVLGGGSRGIYDIEIMQYGTASTTLFPPTNAIKRLFSTTITANNLAGNADDQSSFGSTHFNFSQPIRVSLRPLECIALRITTVLAASSATFLKFSLNGYSFGNFLTDLNAQNLTPFLTNRMYSEHPFPQDNDTADLPRL